VDFGFFLANMRRKSQINKRPLKNIAGGCIILEETLSDIRREAWRLIFKARHLMVEAMRKELVPQQISPRQVHIAEILYKLGRKATLVELAQYSERGVSTLSVQLTRMEKDGLVKKYRENPKSVLKKFELTERGIIAYQKSTATQSIRSIMSVLSEEELQQLILIVNKVINEAEKIKS